MAHWQNGNNHFIFHCTVCKKELDVGIIVDGSSSVTRKNWEKTLDFIKEFSDEFSIGPQGVHFGVLHFSWKVYLDFKISDSQYWSQQSLKNKVSTITYPYGKSVLVCDMLPIW